MRPMKLAVPLLLAASLGGCVAYAGGGYGYDDFGPGGVDEPQYFNDRPAIVYGGQPTFLFDDPLLGFGRNDPQRHWHSAPQEWRGGGARGGGHPDGHPEGNLGGQRGPQGHQGQGRGQGRANFGTRGGGREEHGRN